MRGGERELQHGKSKVGFSQAQVLQAVIGCAFGVAPGPLISSSTGLLRLCLIRAARCGFSLLQA